ncbi:PRC-barrel domain-containing protein [Microvirga guangxiensis]|uniref:PRC-barrel domain-containing protein n=1 Tax=Microvirga guangxiensis TaxID=549386 RepID=A0A1G5J2R7_9HYPH|nr:PRC-barrel domain-containing protein [Microvirga guangxiensis]SCY81998.1 PRC-barrel domain-containing protein [Microvirga guangxiensis]
MTLPALALAAGAIIASPPLVAAQTSLLHDTPPGVFISAVPVSATGSTTGMATFRTVTRILTVDALGNMDVVSRDGKAVGSIDGVVECNTDKKRLVLIERGGLLGLGAKTIALPLDNIAIQSGKVTLHNLDIAQLDGMPEFREDDTAFRKLSDIQQITLLQL